MMQKRTLTGLGIFLLASLLITVFLNDTVRTTAGLYAVQPDGNDWFASTHLATLYFLTPLVITAMIATLLMPGILLVLAGRNEMHIGELLLKGFGLSFIVHVATLTVFKLVSGGTVNGAQFTSILAVTSIACYAWLAIRSGKHNPALQVFADPVNRRRLGWFLAIPALFVALFLPAIFWQELNADGFEAMEIGRTLSAALLPVFPNESGTMGLGIGMVPMAYPINWFMLLTGPLEAATRLPMAMYILVVFAALLACIEYAAPRRLRAIEELVILLALAGYTVAMSYSSGYNNYFTDMSSPAAFETLTLIFILASGYFLWTGMHRWYLLFTVAGFLARPTVLLFVMLMGIGIALVSKETRKTSLLMIGIAIGTWVALLVGYEHMYLASVSGDSGPGYSSSSILGRFQYLTFSDFQRFIYAAAPAGLLPALSLLAWRWQDSFSRCLTIVSAGYYLVFFVPAFTSLHHFVPVMVIPVIVLWRVIIMHSVRLAPAVITGAVMLPCLWLSLPAHFHISRTYSDIGARMQYRIGDYNGDHAAYRQSLAGSKLLLNFFKPDWKIDDPAMELVGGGQILYYASREKSPDQLIDYLVLASDASPPDGFVRIPGKTGGSTWVRDVAILEADRQHPPPTGYHSRLYDISPETLFFYKGVPTHNYDINMSSLPLLGRLFRGR